MLPKNTIFKMISCFTASFNRVNQSKSGKVSVSSMCESWDKNQEKKGKNSVLFCKEKQKTRVSHVLKHKVVMSTSLNCASVRNILNLRRKDASEKID